MLVLYENYTLVTNTVLENNVETHTRTDVTGITSSRQLPLKSEQQIYLSSSPDEQPFCLHV